MSKATTTLVSRLGIIKVTDQGFHAVLAEPVKCGCGRMAMMVVNRDGKTRCCVCDQDLNGDQP